MNSFFDPVKSLSHFPFFDLNAKMEFFVYLSQNLLSVFVGVHKSLDAFVQLDENPPLILCKMTLSSNLVIEFMMC